MRIDPAHSETRTGAQTAIRTLQLLDLLVRSEAPVTLADLAQRAGINKSTAYRLLRVLEDRSYVMREVGTRRYMVGNGLVALAALVLGRIDIRGASRPAMARISERTGETVTIHVRHLWHRICIEGVESRLPIRRAVQLGETLPLYAGPSGKVMLAFLEPSQQDGILAWAAEAGEDIGLIRRQLGAIRERRYMASVGDRSRGVGGLSVPVFNAAGIAASITVAGPGDRWSQEAMDDAAPMVIEECAMLSASLGHDGRWD